MIHLYVCQSIFSFVVSHCHDINYFYIPDIYRLNKRFYLFVSENIQKYAKFCNMCAKFCKYVLVITTNILNRVTKEVQI